MATILRKFVHLTLGVYYYLNREVLKGGRILDQPLTCSLPLVPLAFEYLPSTQVYPFF